MLAPAVALFIKLGFPINRKLKGSWGTSIFMAKTGSAQIQLTDSSDPTSIPQSENHVAIIVENPWLVAQQIKKWALGLNFTQVAIQKVSGNKCFITLPEILTIDIELVPGSSKENPTIF